jgi:multidrug efflux system membrane fusion protein
LIFGIYFTYKLIRDKPALWRPVFMSTIKHFIIIISIVMTIAACSSGSKDKYVPGKAVPITVAVALQKDVPMQLSAIGNVEAYKTVSVRARIGGELEQVYFAEGDYVKEGDLLFLIDPRPYQAAFQQAEANLTRNSVQAANAEKDAQRYAVLVKDGIVTKEQYEQMRTAADALNAAVRADRAAVENAGLQLAYCKVITPPQCGGLDGCEPPQGWPVFQVYSMPRSVCLSTANSSSGSARCGSRLLPGAQYNPPVPSFTKGGAFSPLFFKEGMGEIVTRRASFKHHIFQTESLCQTLRVSLVKPVVYLSKIKSPITGLTGKLMFDRGNMIKANDDKPLVVINQIQPIYVSFSVPERELPGIKKHQSEGKLKVEALIPGLKPAPPAGELTFINNTVDTSTGTILLKATFANAVRALWPGQFVNVVLTLGIQPGAVVIPSQAVQSGQSGFYVFVIKNNLTAEMRMVEAGRAANGDLVIEKGIQPGETVVTDGQLQLSTGTTVEIKNTEKTESQGS